MPDADAPLPSAAPPLSPPGSPAGNFPATVSQARALSEGRGAGALSCVICLEGPSDEELLERILGGRRTSGATGEVYHRVDDPPPGPEERLDPGPFLRRSDDTEESTRAHLEAYRMESDALKEHHEATGRSPGWTQVADGGGDGGDPGRARAPAAPRVLREIGKELSTVRSHGDVVGSPEGATDGRTRGVLSLADGTSVAVLPVSPADAPALKRLHGRLSERSIELRFFEPLEVLSDGLASHLARAPDEDHLALAALEPDGGEEIVAVVRYARKEGRTGRVRGPHRGPLAGTRTGTGHDRAVDRGGPQSGHSAPLRAGDARDLNEAARRFAETLADSYRLVYAQASESGRATARERPGSSPTSWPTNLREQTEASRTGAEHLSEQAERQRQAGQELARESVEAYAEFLDDAFSRYRSSTERAAQTLQEGVVATGRTATRAFGDGDRGGGDATGRAADLRPPEPSKRPRRSPSP